MNNFRFTSNFDFGSLPMSETLEQERDRLRKEIKSLVDRLREEPQVQAVVVARCGDHKVFVRHPGMAMIVSAPPGMRLEPGDPILMTSTSFAILGRNEHPTIVGAAHKVKSIHDGKALLATTPEPYLVLIGKEPVKVGDRVVMDPSNSIILAVIPEEEKISEVKCDEVEWDDVVGQEEAKRALRFVVEGRTKNRELSEAYGIRPTKGVLLHGPPGNGKTMLGKAAATAMARLNGAEPGFVYVKGPEILHFFLGNSEKNARDLFARARSHEERTGSQAVIFIDEADAILCRRDGGKLHEGIERTMVPQFLAEMDGLSSSSGPLVLLATNRPGALDPAVTRDGRIDRKIKVPRPGRGDAFRIALGRLRGRAIWPGRSAEGMAERLEAEVLGDRRRGVSSHVLFRIEGRTKGIIEGAAHVEVGLESFVSGAMIAGIADRAAQLALEEDIAVGSSEALGIREEHVIGACAEKARELRGVADPMVLAEVAEARGIVVQKVEEVFR